MADRIPVIIACLSFRIYCGIHTSYGPATGLGLQAVRARLVSGEIGAKTAEKLTQEGILCQND